MLPRLAKWTRQQKFYAVSKRHNEYFLTTGNYPTDAWELLAPTLTESRRARMQQVAMARTRHIRLVVQDVHLPHNVSACLRSAEALGVQDVDVITLDGRFRPSTAARGVEDWLTMRRHRQIETCVNDLRAKGYRLIAGVPSPDAISLFDLPLTQPLAVLFGNEHAGLHADWLPHIDQAFTIPMVGMVESLNISVSVAIALSHLTKQARQCLEPAYYLTEKEREALLNEWVCKQLHSYEERLARLRRMTVGEQEKPIP